MACRFRLLISARDPGAANNLAPIARLAQASPDIDLHLVASHPADSIFAAAGLNPEPVEHDELALPLVAAQLLQRHQPDAVLVGLSGPGRGIDEALLAAAEKLVPSWALQDFWGDVNNGFGAYADTYLVRDATAARITRERAAVHTVISGLPLQSRTPSGRRQRQIANRLREKYRIPAKSPLIVLCSQPLWEQAGYRETLRQAFQSLPPGHLLVRMHPKEGIREQQKMRRLLHTHCRRPWQLSNDPLPHLLSANDLLLSAFSNVGIDQVHFNHAAASTSSVPVYLLQHPKLRALFRKWTALEHHPLCELGSALCVEKTRNLAAQLRLASSSPMRRRHSRAAGITQHCQASDIMSMITRTHDSQESLIHSAGA